MGLAGSWAAGAALVDGDEPARDRVTTGRAAIFTGGRPVRLPDHCDGWRWEPYAVDGIDIDAARQQLQRLMRDTAADIAEALSDEGWLTVLDGPLHGIRHRRGLPVIGSFAGGGEVLRQARPTSRSSGSGAQDLPALLPQLALRADVPVERHRPDAELAAQLGHRRVAVRHRGLGLRRLYGFRSFSGGAARELGERLRDEAEQAQSNEDLARRFVEACRRTRTILPATTTIERLCADALVDAERRIEARIAERVPPGLRRDLEHLLEETADAGVTRFVWLRQFEPGSNSADANRLLDRLEHVRRLDVPEGLFHEIPPHRITRLRRQG